MQQNDFRVNNSMSKRPTYSCAPQRHSTHKLSSHGDVAPKFDCLLSSAAKRVVCFRCVFVFFAITCVPPGSLPTIMVRTDSISIVLHILVMWAT